MSGEMYALICQYDGVIENEIVLSEDAEELDRLGREYMEVPLDMPAEEVDDLMGEGDTEYHIRAVKGAKEVVPSNS